MSGTPDQMVTITKKEYNSLKSDEKMLRHLEANGVDNWEWYSRPDNDEDDQESEAKETEYGQ